MRKKYEIIGGDKYCLKDAAKLRGINPSTYYTRRHRKKKGEELISPQNFNELEITHNGETHSLAYWAKKYNIDYGTMLARHRKGQYLFAAYKPKKKVRWIKELAEETGLSYNCIYLRLRRGWTIAEVRLPKSNQKIKSRRNKI